MEFKDKLYKKKPRIKWYKVVCCSMTLLTNFQQWCRYKKFKIKSLDRLAYLFLRAYCGLVFINHIRELAIEGRLDYETNNVYRLFKSPWIAEVED